MDSITVPRSLFQTRLYRFLPWNRTSHADLHGWRKCKRIVGKASASSVTASSTIAPALFYYLPSMAVCVTLIPSIHGHMHCSRSLFQTRLYRFHPWNRTTYTDLHGWRKCIKIVGNNLCHVGNNRCHVVVSPIVLYSSNIRNIAP